MNGLPAPAREPPCFRCGEPGNSVGSMGVPRCNHCWALWCSMRRQRLGVSRSMVAVF